MRQRLARALSLPEKKMLRETLRNVVMGQPEALAPANAFPPDTEEEA